MGVKHVEPKYIIIIQCDIAHNRCSGYACTNAFYNKEGMFSVYKDTVRYISFTCGGCCGKGVAAKLEHLAVKLKNNGISKEDVVIHLSSCMTTNNYHYDRCPNVDYIKSIVARKGFRNVVEGSYISKNATMKRAKGIY